MIKTVFLDLDDTLFDFHRAEAVALSGMLAEIGVAPTKERLSRYSEINRLQWKRLERGEATREEILIDRFKIFFLEFRLERDVTVAKRIYEHRLGLGHYFIDGAEELLEAIHGKYDLYLASNGTAKVQKGRIESSGIEKYFKKIFISEIIGHNKPEKKFFDCCFAQIDGFKKEEAIIVGDSLTSDILGGINAGIKTCLFNPEEKPRNKEIKPDYEITKLCELPKLLEKI